MAKKALVISGGGSKGAFAGGFAEYLIKDLDRQYDILIGTSTGSLIVPQLATGQVDKIQEAYTHVSTSDIYNICPFTIKEGKNGKISVKINHLNILGMFLKGKKSFGEHLNLRKTIGRFFTEEDFNLAKNSGKQIVITVSNLSLNIVEYKHIYDCTYEDFCDWMWASSSFVPFMSLVEKNGYEYADGGFGNVLPIEEAVNLGATEIDAIILNPRVITKHHKKSKNAFDVMMKSIQFMHRQNAINDILIGHLESLYNHNVKVNFHFTPRLLTEYSFHFDPEKMEKWWEEGYEFAKSRLGTKNSD